MAVTIEGWKRVPVAVSGILRQVTVEPFLFFYMFGTFVRFVSYQNMLMERTCLSVYSEDICSDLNSHPVEKSESTKLGNDLFTGTMLISTLPAFVTSMFIGPWSDTYGRRYALICSSSGQVINSIFCLIITLYPNSSPYLFLAGEIPSGVAGGMVVAISSTYSYMSDITTERTRPVRYSILEFFFIIAMPVGTIVGGQAFAWKGYVAVMSICLCGYICALAWAIFVVKESKRHEEEVTVKKMMRDLFRVDNIKASFKTCTQPRPGNLRKQLWLLVLASCISKYINMGTVTAGYPFARTVFHWEVESYSNRVTLFFTIDAFATMFVIPTIYRKFLLHEAALGLIGTFSLMAKMALLAVAFKEGIFYYAWISGILNPGIGISIRSRMSKLVSRDELGRVFSLLATCESLTPVLGIAITTQIFNATVDFYPGFLFAINTLLLIPPVIIFSWMTTLPSLSFTEYKESVESSGMNELRDVSQFK